jgi:hypothetical protein
MEILVVERNHWIREVKISSAQQTGFQMSVRGHIFNGRRLEGNTVTGTELRTGRGLFRKLEGGLKILKLLPVGDQVVVMRYGVLVAVTAGL